MTAGTFELIARELGATVSMLGLRLEERGAEGMLADLGMQLPGSATQASDVLDAIDAVVLLADELPGLVGVLDQAIQDEDTEAAIAAGLDLVTTAVEAVDAVATFASALEDAAAGTLTDDERAELATFAEALPGRLLEYLVVERLRERLPTLAAVLELLGIAERVLEPADPGRRLQLPHERRAVRLDRIPLLLTSPTDFVQEVFGWGTAGIQERVLLHRVHRFLDEAMGLTSVLLTLPGGEEVLEAYLLVLRVDHAATPPELVVGLRFAGGAEVHREVELRAPWAAAVTAAGEFLVGVEGRIVPPFTVTVTPPTGAFTAELALGVAGERADPPILLLGAAGGTRLQARRVALQLGARAALDTGLTQATLTPTVDAELVGGRLIVSLGGSDGFLGSSLPASFEAAADLAAEWNPVDGLVIRGGAALAITVPLGIDLGPARLDQLDLALKLLTGKLALEARIAGGVKLGPFAAAVEGVGAAADLVLAPGNLGPVGLAFRFLPPRGLGLAIDAGPVKGGGFISFDEEAGRYSGVLQVKISAIGITAIGLLDTKLPGGAPGFSLLVLLRADFPAIQLGFGIALTSVGGLLGLNRRVDVDALRQRFASGAVGRIMTPEDPIRDAPVLLAELGAIFPVTPGVTVVGPTLQLSWASLVTLDLGIILELPGPSKIVLLGSARATIGNPSGEDPYLQIRLDILGVLDFAKRVLEFDAVLLNSQLLGVFELTGGAAFRLSWGDEPYIVLSVGGFHPSYDPAPLAFPASLTRIAMVRGAPTDLLYLRFEGYFAITTNTLQFGAAVQVIVNAGPVRAEGFLGFDALIRFQPFWFEFTFTASMTIAFRGVTLAGVRVTGVLSGPGPVTFTGELCLEILFFRICWNGTFTLGSSEPPPVRPVTSALPVLGDELRAPGNLSATGADDPFVAVAPPRDTALPILVPVGQLTWTQKRAPLGLLLQRFEGAPLEQHETITATGTAVGGASSDWFAPGGFTQLSDSEALNRPALERLQGGVVLGAAGERTSAAVSHAVTVDQYRVAAEPRPVAAATLPGWLQASVNRRDGVEDVPRGAPVVTVATESWTVCDTAGAEIESGLSQSQSHQLARTGGGVAVAAGDRVTVQGF